MWTLIIVIIATIILFAIPSKAEVYVAEQPQDIRYEIVEQAFYYGANPRELLAVARCESNFVKTAVGDGGKAKNIYQYHEPTWNAFRGIFERNTGTLGLEYDSAEDQAQLTAYIFANHPELKSHWVCAQKLGYVSANK